MKRAILSCIGASLPAAVAGASLAQSWPARPIRLIVPFPPGGSNDIVGRLVGAELTEQAGIKAE